MASQIGTVVTVTHGVQAAGQVMCTPAEHVSVAWQNDNQPATDLDEHTQRTMPTHTCLASRQVDRMVSHL